MSELNPNHPTTRAVSDLRLVDMVDMVDGERLAREHGGLPT